MFALFVLLAVSGAYGQYVLPYAMTVPFDGNPVISDSVPLTVSLLTDPWAKIIKDTLPMDEKKKKEDVVLMRKVMDEMKVMKEMKEMMEKEKEKMEKEKEKMEKDKKEKGRKICLSSGLCFDKAIDDKIMVDKPLAKTVMWDVRDPWMTGSWMVDTKKVVDPWVNWPVMNSWVI